MKIEFLDDKCNTARLTRGWIWKKTAVVERELNADRVHFGWWYVAPGTPADGLVYESKHGPWASNYHEVEVARDEELARREKAAGLTYEQRAATAWKVVE